MPDQKYSVYPVLLAGGTGTRLWPVSRELFPKQLVNFIGKESLIQSTIKRLSPILDTDKIRIVCGKEHFHEIARHMEEIGVQSEGKIICEPCGRNTGPAILLSVFNIFKSDKEAVLCIFPADHAIKNISAFHKNVVSAVRLAGMGYVVTFGILPHYPETGYGYIEGADDVFENARPIKRFVEKPDRETAEQYLKAGNFFWNSGMFIFKASVIIDEFKIYQPELFKKMGEILSENDPPSKRAYERLPDISIDYAIMEKTKKGIVLPVDFGWSDIGSWKSLYDFLPKDKNNNVIDGDVITKDTENSFIMASERLIATNRLNNMVIIETPDSVFVSDINSSREVKTIVTRLKEMGRKEYYKHKTVHHAWGSATVLEHGENYKVDRMIIYPGAEYELDHNGGLKKHIVVIKGTVKIVTDDQTIFLKEGESTSVHDNDTINKMNMVRLENPESEPLSIIQTSMHS